MMREFEEIKWSFQGAHVRDQQHTHSVPLRMKKLDLDNKDVARHWDHEEREILFCS
jgi:hypothetical protein